MSKPLVELLDKFEAIWAIAAFNGKVNNDALSAARADIMTAYTSELASRDTAIGELVEALTKLRLTAALLKQNAEVCAAKHHAFEFARQGMPGWLADCQRDIERTQAAIEKWGKR